MTMPLRDYALDKFGWKAASLVIAILIWLAVYFNNRGNLAPAKNRVENPLKLRRPITVMSVATDARSFRVTPSTVEVTIGGEAVRLAGMKESDIEVFVNLKDVMGAKSLRKKVQVFMPGYVRLIQVEPEEVSVEPATAVDEVPSNHTKD